MDVLGRYNALVEKHAELERQLETQTALPRPDESLVNSLKKQKLMMKDQIQALQRQLSQERRPSVSS